MNKVIYNVTYGVEEQVLDAWLTWMEHTRIPEMLATGMFVSAHMLRVSSDHIATPTYAVQYVCEDGERYEQYQEQHAARVEAAENDPFHQHAHSLQTLLVTVLELTGHQKKAAVASQGS